MTDITSIDITAELAKDSEQTDWYIVCTPPVGA